MRNHDISESMDTINLKIGWYRLMARHLVSNEDAESLLGVVEQGRTNPSKIATLFIPALGDEHPLYGNLIGIFICRTALEKLGLYDEVLRPAPGKVEMGRIEDVLIFYHPDTNEYEVSDSHLGVRFPALFVPVFGLDAADEHCAVEIALAIASSVQKDKVFLGGPGFLAKKTLPPLPTKRNFDKLPRNSIRNRRR